MIQLKHIQNGLPQQLQVCLREAGGFPRQIGGDVTLGPVQCVGDNVFSTHLRALLFRVSFRGDGNAGDRHFLGHNGIDTAGKSKLHRPANLTAVQRPLNKGGHNSAEGADIKEIGAHEVPDFLIEIGVFFLCFLQLGRVHTHIGAGLRVAAVQRNAVLHINPVAGFCFLHRFHIVADFPLQAHIRHQAVAGFGVDPGHISGVRVAVGIAVFHIEENHKFIPVLNDSHVIFPPFLCSGIASDGSSPD